MSISGGEYSTQVRGNDVIVTVGEEKISLISVATLSNIHINDTVINGDGSSGVTGDNIRNTTTNTVITGSENNDKIYNNAVKVTIYVGDGNDTIDNHVHNVTLRGGKGNDYICTVDRAIIEGGEDDDTIFADVNNGDSITIRGGSGNDSICFSRYNYGHLVEYTNGDGNEIIEGFNSNSTLSITGEYSTQVSNSDVVVTVDEGKITLKGAASLSGLNINNNDIFETKWTINGTIATYGTPKEILVTVSRVTSTSGFTVEGKTIKIAEDTIKCFTATSFAEGISDNTTITLRADYTDTFKANNFTNVNASNASNVTKVIKIVASNTASTLNGGDGKDVIYGFDNIDTLTLDNLTFSSSSYSKKNQSVTLKFDNGSIIFKDFTATTFHINNDTYKITGTKLVRK